MRRDSSVLQLSDFLRPCRTDLSGRYYMLSHKSIENVYWRCFRDNWNKTLHAEAIKSANQVWIIPIIPWWNNRNNPECSVQHSDYSLIFVDYSNYSLDYSLDYSMDYSFSLWLFQLFKWIIPIIAFSLYGLFAPDNFQIAFPPSSLRPRALGWSRDHDV